jgi:hypothetical protein
MRTPSAGPRRRPRGPLLPGGGNVAGMALSDTDNALFNQQRAAFYVALTFHGELQLEERPND